MGQFSMKICASTGSLLGDNQQLKPSDGANPPLSRSQIGAKCFDDGQSAIDACCQRQPIAQSSNGVIRIKSPLLLASPAASNATLPMQIRWSQGEISPWDFACQKALAGGVAPGATNPKALQ